MIKRIGWMNHRLAEEYLERHELMLGPLYGNLQAHGWLYQSGSLRSGRICGLLSDRTVTGMMGRFNDGNCMIHAACEPELMRFVPELNAVSFHTLWILGGGRGVARQINDALGLQARVVDHLMMIQRRPPQPEADELLEFRDISTDPYDPEYLSAACRLLEACFHYTPSQQLFAQRIAERLPEEIYLMARYRGDWAAQAHIQAWTPHYGHIGGVATLPAYTGLGIGRRVTGRLCRYIHESGRLPTLTVRTDNLPALALYRRLGFEDAGAVTVLDTFSEQEL